ncbi:MAG: aldehyde ferredoxin oxidoreductase N-terminal domain-containing protein [Syntrophorhabdus sp.]
MIRSDFRILKIDLSSGKGKYEDVEGRDTVAGGSGLAALLFSIYGHADKPWDDPDQPIIFVIGPLTGYFPLMSKTVCAFKSPYHNQYTESHGGGRSALALRFADVDALVITGRANRLSILSIGSGHFDIRDAHFMREMDVFRTGRMLRRMFGSSGHRSILRIGPAGERGAPTSCINADTYRHFGRLGGGGAMGTKNLKAVVIIGDKVFDLPEGDDYGKLYREVYRKLTDTDIMKKYHDLGTPANVASLNEIRALPIRNLLQTTDPEMAGITGERFASDALLRNHACSGCPVGCIHVGYVRERFTEENRYFYLQVSYDHEPVFAVGSMLGVTDCFAVLGIIDAVEKVGLDVMSAGVCLAWATEAIEKGLVSEKETLAPLKFGDASSYRQAMHHLGVGTNDFYQILSQGVQEAAKHYGGSDFACVLGQEMAGYATGEVFFISQALGFRHSHLDSAGYSFDQKTTEKDVNKAVDFLLKDERERVLLTSMVSCLFARNVYTNEIVSDCLRSLGYDNLAARLDSISSYAQQLRWNLRFASGFNPDEVTIPKRFGEVTTVKGPIDLSYLNSLKKEYGERIRTLASAAPP